MSFGLRSVVLRLSTFALWTNQPYWSARDIDLLSYGDHSVVYLKKSFSEVCRQTVNEDGWSFIADSVASVIIKPDQVSQGPR